jgi:hypothetical protein
MWRPIEAVRQVAVAAVFQRRVDQLPRPHADFGARSLATALLVVEDEGERFLRRPGDTEPKVFPTLFVRFSLLASPGRFAAS